MNARAHYRGQPRWVLVMRRASIHTPEHALLVALLRDRRLEAGLTQQEAAARLGRPQSYVSSIETGDRGLDLFQVRELAALYGGDFLAFAAELEARLASKPVRPLKRKRPAP